jgi:archaemetzincin
VFSKIFKRKIERKILEIEFLGFVDSILFKSLKVEIEKHIKLEVVQYESLFDLDTAFNEERNQYYSPTILNHLVIQNNGSASYRMAIVNADLFNPVFKYIYGEAQLNGRLSVISLFRLHEELYTGEADYNKLFYRTLKEIYHELGHNLGLVHCLNWDCVMHTSTSVEEIDIKGDFYCPECFKKANVI